MAENEVVEILTTDEINELDRLLMENPEQKKKVKQIVRKVLQKARSEVAKQAKGIVGSGYANSAGDPRQAYRAVKRSVYKKIVGGAISILAARRASATRVTVTRSGTLRPGQRGGNRRSRSDRTKQIDSYWGKDRGFILRFLNAGTNTRTTQYGQRGSISARNWFGNASQRELEKAAEQFCQLIDQEIQNITNESKQS